MKVYESDGTLESVVVGSESFLKTSTEEGGEALDYSEGNLDAAVDSQGRIYVLDSVAKQTKKCL